MQYYLHIINRDDMDSDYWTEYRLSDKNICPEYLDSIWVEEKLEYMQDYCKEQNIEYTIIDHR